MRVLLTGATGNLGRAMVGRLLAEGHDVGILTRRPFLAASLFGTTVTLHEWHPLTEPVPAGALTGVDAILHMTGASLAGGPSRERTALAVTSRTTATRRLVAALAGGPIRLVVTSLALARQEPGEAVTEDTPPPSNPSPAERAVAAWEAEAMAATSAGASVAIVRLGLIAQPGGPLAALARMAGLGIGPAMHHSLISAIAIEDAVAMLSGLLQDRALEGLIHGVAPVAVPGAALTGLLRRISPMPTTLQLPTRLVGGSLGLTAQLVTGRRQVAPMRLVAAGASFAAPDPSASLERALHALAAARGQSWLALPARRRPSEPSAGTAEPT